MGAPQAETQTTLNGQIAWIPSAIKTTLPKRPITPFLSLRNGHQEPSTAMGINGYFSEAVVNQGHVNDPKTGRSKGAIPVIKQVAERLKFHHERAGKPESGPMFPNGAKNAECMNNVLNRQILPALKRCEVCGKAEVEHKEADGHDFKLGETFPKWHGWHAARRGLGSNLYVLGVPEKVIQQILRHANVSTTATYYIKTVPTQVTDAMEKLEQALPESLSGNEVATLEWKPTASSAVN